MLITEIIEQWNDRMEEMYLDVASQFREQEAAGNFSLVYDREKDTVKSMSESMLEWAAEARERKGELLRSPMIIFKIFEDSD